MRLNESTRQQVNETTSQRDNKSTRQQVETWHITPMKNKKDVIDTSNIFYKKIFFYLLNFQK